jgi:uncharacterized protein involved in outer membrane biogenesis
VEILVDPLGKPLPFSEVTGTKPKAITASVGDYVFGLTAKGRYNGQPLSGKGKSAACWRCGAKARRSRCRRISVPVTRVAFVGTVNDPMNMGGVDLQLKFAGDSLGELYD